MSKSRKTCSLDQMQQLMLVVVLVMTSVVHSVSGQNLTAVLLGFTQYSQFNSLLSSTGVAQQLAGFRTYSVMLPSNDVLTPWLAANSKFTTGEIANVLRYHVLMNYFTVDELRGLNGGENVTTLYQDTGNAYGQDGMLTITDGTGGEVFIGPVGVKPTVQIVTNITQFPYNLTMFKISGVLVPLGLVALPPSPTPAPVPAPAPVPVKAPAKAAPTLSTPATKATAPSANAATALLVHQYSYILLLSSLMLFSASFLLNL